MKIPALFYGTAGDVTRRVRKLARQLALSRDFATYDPGPLLDTDEHPCAILINEEFEWSTDSHFHCYHLWEAIVDASPSGQARNNVHDWLMSSLEDDWRFVCTMGSNAGGGLLGWDPSCSRRYLDAAIRHWPAIAALRGRFGTSDVLESWHTLFGALEILGFPSIERLQVPGRTPEQLLAALEERSKS